MDNSKLIETITQEVLKALNDGKPSSFATGSSEILPNGIDINKLNKTIDHTVLRPATTKATVERFCREAIEYGFASVCVNPIHVKYVAGLLKGTDVKTCTVIGFPLGATTPFVKATEVRDAIANGVQEVDMVMNIGAMKDGDYDLVLKDMKAVVEAAAGKALVKVIIETCLLTDEEKVKACLLAKEAGADFVKTSTGMSTGGATVEDVALMKKTGEPEIKVKASGGIVNRKIALDMIRAGAVRLGASKGIEIVTDKEQNAQQPTCVGCGNCNMTCPTGNAQIVKVTY